MKARRAIGRAAWAAFGVFAILDIVGLASGRNELAHLAQPLAALFLLTAFVLSVRTWSPPAILTAAGVAMAWVGDTLPPVLTADARLSAAISFLLAMIAYSAALAPLWMQTRDGLRMLLAIPYAGVVVGLVVACIDGAGALTLPVLAYALTLAVMSFFAAGVSSLTWVGGTFLLLSSSMLGMSWFLPGAWIPHTAVWVMATYFVGHAALLAGILSALPSASAQREPDSGLGGATLIILDA